MIYTLVVWTFSRTILV